MNTEQFLEFTGMMSVVNGIRPSQLKSITETNIYNLENLIERCKRMDTQLQESINLLK